MVAGTPSHGVILHVTHPSHSIAGAPHPELLRLRGHRWWRTIQTDDGRIQVQSSHDYWKGWQDEPNHPEVMQLTIKHLLGCHTAPLNLLKTRTDEQEAASHTPYPA